VPKQRSPLFVEKLADSIKTCEAMKIGQRISELRNDLRPSSDAHQDAGQRGAGRTRRVAITGSTAVMARVVQVSTSLITIPLAVHYLGNERFGLWMTVSSVLAMANFADFGVGNGVLNTVADAFGKNDFDRIRAAISSGFAVLSTVGLLLLALFASTFAWVSWADVFRVTSAQARAEAAPALMIFAFCFALNIPLDLVQRAQMGLQQGFRMNLWQVCGSLAGLAGVIIGIRMHAGLPLLVAAVAGAPVAAVALNTFHFFVVSRPDLRPRHRFVSRDVISRILTFGTLFFILQLVAAVAFSADNIIVARTLGASSVPEYSIPQRLFSLISMMVVMMVTPLWPAYGEAISRGDIPWVRRTLGRSLVLVFGFATVASMAMLLIAHRLLGWWIGPRISPPFVLLLGLALWTVVDCCGNTIAMFLNGASIMRFQVGVASIFGATCLAVKIYLTGRYGIVAVPWATLFTYVSIVGISCAIYVPRALRHLHPAPHPVTIATPVVED
jgi:O-antigen/teichoic acid export membrane protein